MRELRNTKIIAVDHGYGNMKNSKHRHANRNQSFMKQNHTSSASFHFL